MSLFESLFKLGFIVSALIPVIPLNTDAKPPLLTPIFVFVLKKSITPNSFKYIIFSTAEVSDKSRGSGSVSVVDFASIVSKSDSYRNAPIICIRVSSTSIPCFCPSIK